MLAIERRREIIARLTSDGKVIVTELAKDFGVTEETIRRDLEKLDKEGVASKTYGGAVSKNASALPPHKFPTSEALGFIPNRKKFSLKFVARRR